MTPPSGIALHQRLAVALKIAENEAQHVDCSTIKSEIARIAFDAMEQHWVYVRDVLRELDALIAASASPSSGIHRDCHDLTCNGDRRHPRGTEGVGCSCRARDASLFFSETTQVCGGQSATVTMESNNVSQQASASVEPSASQPPTVWIVRYQNYWPMEVDTIWLTHVDAEARAQARGDGWMAQPYNFEAATP